jgi:outer membrane immunogenic protein
VKTKLIVAFVSSGAWVVCAAAADMPVKAPVYNTPSSPVVYNWTGFYAGVNGGYGVGDDATRNVGTQSPAAINPQDSFNAAPRGVLGGAQAGFNWQLAPRWLVGVEADIQGADVSDTACVGTCNLIQSGQVSVINQRLTWFGTARARAGWIAGPTLFYLTGGWAFGHASESGTNEVFNSIPLLPVPFSATPTNSGFAVGAGAESRLFDHWTLKAEYLYVELGHATATSVVNGIPGIGGPISFAYQNDVREHVFRAGLNYHLGEGSTDATPIYYKTSTIRGAPNDWTGGHVGANGGYAAGSSATSDILSNNGGFGGVFGTDSFNVAPHGILAGGQIGYDWQLPRDIVFGTESDIQWSGISGGLSCTADCDPTQGFGNSAVITQQRVAWFGTARGRVGWVDGRALYYATGGLAFGEINSSVTGQFDILPSPTISGTQQFNELKAGWTVGGGLETAIDEHWSIKAEYLYLDFGHVSGAFVVNTTPLPFFVAPSSVTYNSDPRLHVFRFGLNYKL